MNLAASRVFTITGVCLLVSLVPLSAQTGGRAAQNAAERLDAASDGDAAMLYVQAQEAEMQGNRQRALALYRTIARSFPLAPQASASQFRVAQILEELNNPNRAFDAYQELIAKFPDSQEFERAVAAQINIANEYLNGKKLDFLGMPILNANERTQQMFGSIVANAPFSRYAPIAQFNLGLAYERQGKVQDAVSAYQKVIDTYPNSDAADDALYQIGYVYLRVGMANDSQDLSAIITAKHTFEDFLLQYPNSEKAAQARDNLKRINDQEASDIMRIAAFYDRYKDYKAAAIYYNDVIRRQPQSENAEVAKVRIEELRSEIGDDALRPGPERTETGERAQLRRRLQAQVETSALSNYDGPSKRDIVPDELPVVSRPRLRSNLRDATPLPAVEPDLPAE